MMQDEAAWLNRASVHKQIGKNASVTHESGRMNRIAKCIHVIQHLQISTDSRPPVRQSSSCQ